MIQTSAALMGIAQGVSLCFLKLAPKRQLVPWLPWLSPVCAHNRAGAQAQFAPNSRHNADRNQRKVLETWVLSSNLL